MNLGVFTKEQQERIDVSLKTRKYGHLETWKELFCYQLQHFGSKQCLEIAEWAERQNREGNVLLPLMRNKTI